MIETGWICGCGWRGGAEDRAWSKGLCCCPKCGSAIQHYVIRQATPEEIEELNRPPVTLSMIPGPKPPVEICGSPVESNGVVYQTKPGITWTEDPRYPWHEIPGDPS